jgi:hypothetical protein
MAQDEPAERTVVIYHLLPTATTQAEQWRQAIATAAATTTAFAAFVQGIAAVMTGQEQFLVDLAQAHLGNDKGNDHPHSVEREREREREDPNSEGPRDAWSE